MAAARVVVISICACVALSLGACGGSSTTAKSSSPGTSSASSKPSTSPRVTPSSTQESPSEVIDFDVSGSISGKQVSGKLSNTNYSIPCVGAGANQILTVHWTGNSGTTQLQGEIDFKPGTWTIGTAAAQGTASVGLLGGKAADDLAATSGTVTTQAAGGSIDATFANGPGSVHVSGTWTCP